MTRGVWVSDGCGGEFALGSTKEGAGGSNFVGMFEAYGQLRTHLGAFNDDLEVQDNATRVGMNFATRGTIKMFAGTEWGVNLVRSETQFNLSAAGRTTSEPSQPLRIRCFWPARVHRSGFWSVRQGRDREAECGAL